MTVDGPFPENKLDTLGLFSWKPSSSGERLGVQEREARIHGRQFTTRPARTGLGPDVTFSRFSSIHVGDVFISPEQRRRAYDKEKKKLQLTPTPFKATSPPQRPSGQGTYTHGGFSNYPYMKVSDHFDKGPPFKPKLPAKNFYTSPAKKGTYGNIGMNIGGKLDGVVGELGYKASPPLPKQKRPQSEHARGFAPASPAKKGTHGYVGLNIGGSPGGLFGEYGYETDGRYDDHFKNSKYMMARPAKPFIPSSPPKFGGGVHGFIGKYPAHADEHEAEQFELERTRQSAERAKIIGGVFRPGGVPKSIRSPSVLNMKANQHRRNW